MHTSELNPFSVKPPHLNTQVMTAVGLVHTQQPSANCDWIKTWE